HNRNIALIQARKQIGASGRKAGAGLIEWPLFQPARPERGQPMITLSINGEARTLPGPQSVADLLQSLGIPDPRRIAVEVNRDLVPRTRHAERLLSDGDQVEIVTLVGGGSAPLPAPDKPLKIGKFTFTSRLITGTG